MPSTIELAEAGLVPDWLIRIGIRRLLSKRMRQSGKTDVRQFADDLRRGPLAVETQVANRQHYEVSSDFFGSSLGPRLKYSCCLFTSPDTSLADAEEQMLRLTCERAEVTNGMHILELGCGWGSLTLWIAENYPQCNITAVSNSASQRQCIERKAAENGYANVQVITADMRDFTIDKKFDRIVSVEMFEHMRNYELLFSRIADWLNEDGKAFVHVFCHRETPYFFETAGTGDWMGRNFFTGGVMPSLDLFSHFEQSLKINNQWDVNGLHYWRTCEAWLRKADLNRDQILEQIGKGLSPVQAKRNLQKWRIFFMACAELFRYRKGQEWFVAHYLFGRA